MAREHDHDDTCWCDPNAFVVCPSCLGEATGDPECLGEHCYRCHGAGLIQTTDRAEALVFIHNELGG